MREIYSWVPWFTELCDRIANNVPEFLAERARRIPWKEGSDEAALLRYGDDNIDPFSFVYSLAAHHHARKRVYAGVAEEFQLTSELPLELDEAFIFPTPPLVTALFHNRGKGIRPCSGVCSGARSTASTPCRGRTSRRRSESAGWLRRS